VRFSDLKIKTANCVIGASRSGARVLERGCSGAAIAVCCAETVFVAVDRVTEQNRYPRHAAATASTQTIAVPQGRRRVAKGFEFARIPCYFVNSEA